ncbi:DUF1365 domain-containing protein [Motilimonas sp. E26]|uniref:DUF1365 domain-containing protein n=1 Tax=Motilimonas sp. E26 TaxID=2865674 RepID=UPI001E53BD8E|nr:DUF1365 domain-containing protein [Motilimonas sp. E26]MCE0558065.1 DUF1365 domain-containing protein [Motilimonas sp. E26]
MSSAPATLNQDTTLEHSAIYTGIVRHRRFSPVGHEFKYQVFFLGLDLDELGAVEKLGSWFKQNRWAPLSFNHQDYLHKNQPVSRQAVWQKVQDLGGVALNGRVLMLGQLRCFGIYFSPVNFYYCYNDADELIYLLAEVSNTPWNERHYYLVDIAANQPTDKVFHVSPFMDLNMKYYWRIKAPGKQLRLHMENRNEAKLFDASLMLQRVDLTNQNLRKQVIKLPSMAIKTLAGIYWQALKLYLKKVPYIPHPGPSTEQKNG